MEVVTVLRPVIGTDGYGDPYTDWSVPTRTDVQALGVEPRPSAEPVMDARNATTSGFTVYLPPSWDILPGDRLEIRGNAYDVIGDAQDWRSPWGWRPGLIVQTQRTVG